MMKFITLTIGFLLVVQTAWGNQSSMEKWKELILNSIKYSQEADFQSTYAKGKESVVIRRKHFDKIECERRDYYMDGNNLFSTIRNADGMFFIKNDILLKNKMKNFEDEYPSLNWKWAWNAIIRDLQVDCQYLVSQTSYKGIPCYSIRVTTPSDDQSLSILAKESLEQVAAKKDQYSKYFPAVKQLYINRENLFMYHCIMFNNQGKKLTEMNWGKVEFKAPDDSCFKLPQGKIDTVKSKQDMIDLAKKRNAGSGIWVRTIDYIDQNFSSIVSTSIKIALGIAIICVILAIILKFRSK